MHPLILVLLISGLIEVGQSVVFSSFNTETTLSTHLRPLHTTLPLRSNVYWKSFIASIQRKQAVVKTLPLLSGVRWAG